MTHRRGASLVAKTAATLGLAAVVACGADQRADRSTVVDLGQRDAGVGPAVRAGTSGDRVGEGDAGAIAWLADEAAARARALKTDQPLLIVVTAEWSAACKELMTGLFGDPRVVRATRAVVAVRVDATDDEGPNDAVLARLRVTSVPTIIVLTPGGSEVLRSQGHVEVEALLDALGGD